MKEEWKPIKNFEGIYEISNLGNVKSLSRHQVKGRVSFISKERILKPKIHNGYKIVNLHKINETEKERKNCSFYIHRLVAEAFVRNPKGLNIVNHKDGNKTNNAS